MRSIWAPHNREQDFGLRPAMYSFADECMAVVGRLLAYMGCLALLAMAAVAAYDHLELDWTPAAVPAPGWVLADRSAPAFAVRQPNSGGITESYQIMRHPEGGRKDILRWTAADRRLVAELELYRLGGEAVEGGPGTADIAALMDPVGPHQTVGEGIIDSKFGPVALFGLAGGPAAGRHCLGFARALDAADLSISGWSCQGDGLPARRAAIACMLDRLVLLGAGSDGKLAELFAHAELKRSGCAGPALSAAGSDWVTGTQTPALRGSL